MKTPHSNDHTGWWVGGISVALMVVVIITISVTSRSPSYANKTNRELALLCTTDMATQFHIHPHLQIIINGKEEGIPANIGIQPTCMNSIHTHDATGKIHVEAPEKRDFTLADFFAAWNKPFNKDQVLEYRVDGAHRIREAVNGKDVQGMENTVLRDNDQIVIYYETIK